MNAKAPDAERSFPSRRMTPLAWIAAGMLALVLPAFAHDGHTHTPVGQWFFWPDYTLEGKSRNPVGPHPAPPTTSFDIVDQDSPPLRFRGEAPTERVSRLVSPELIPSRAFSAELWVVDHVNQPVSALMTARSREGDPPAWVLAYDGDRVRFTVRTGGQPEPVTLEFAAPPGFKKYWRHLVGTYDGEQLKVYVNGQLAASAPATGTVSLPARPDLEIAAYLAREPFMELGNLVREARLYDDDIGAAQAKERFHALAALVEEGHIYADRFHFTAGPALTFMTERTASLMWETDRPASALIRYGTRVPLEREERVGSAATLQSLHLNGLEPETGYFYEVIATAADGQEVRSGMLTFRTARRESSPTTFVVVGDTEARPHINHALARAIWGERPDFLVNVGDLTDGGQEHHKFEWNLEYYLGMTALLGRVPMFPVPGNGESDLFWYRRYHPMPVTPERYSFRYGAAEFFMVDSNRPMGPGSEQHAWLDRALAGSRAPWKFVCHHHPVYSSDDDDHGDAFAGPTEPGDPNPRGAVDLYEKHAVDIVFYGHIHAYERTWPMRGGVVDEQRGVRYVQTGGGGGNLEDFGPQRNAYTGKLYRGHHYCLVNLQGGILRFQMYDVEGRLRDSFELRKP